MTPIRNIFTALGNSLEVFLDAINADLARIFGEFRIWSFVTIPFILSFMCLKWSFMILLFPLSFILNIIKQFDNG